MNNLNWVIVILMLFLASIRGWQVYDKLLLMEAEQNRQSIKIAELQERLDLVVLRLGEIVKEDGGDGRLCFD